LTAIAEAVQQACHAVALRRRLNRPYLHRLNISSFQSIISIVPQTRDAAVIRDK
jgi:hypothetical protein